MFGHGRLAQVQPLGGVDERTRFGKCQEGPQACFQQHELRLCDMRTNMYWTYAPVAQMIDKQPTAMTG